MKLANFEAGGSVRAGLVREGSVYEIPGSPGAASAPTVDEILRGNLPQLRQEEARILAGSGRPIETVLLRSPILRPSRVISVTASQPRAGVANSLVAPRFWIRSGSYLSGPGARLVSPAGERANWEVGLGVVIGRRAAKVRISEALNCVAGYAVCVETSLTHPHAGGQATTSRRAKPAYGPISVGPWIVTREEVPDPDDLGLTVRVNGEQKARSSTSQLSIKVRAVISYASVAMPLDPGDVISTAGVMNLAPLRASASPMDGDQLEGRIDRIGGLINPVWG